ncbi:hypothetical protein IDG86_02375 [Pelagibacterales bacterium SAG-MED13]|nr:hypothetical protein [Pelagibacterales bacterium SAG-MED13]
MKTIRPFGPILGKTRVTNNFIKKLNQEFDLKVKSNFKDYSSELTSQIKNEVKINKSFVDKYLSKEIKKFALDFLRKDNIKNIKDIKILNLWVVRQFKGEYNPVHYHTGDLSGVGYIKIPYNMTTNKLVKNKKIKTNGTIDFINGQKNFLSQSIYNIIPKVGDLILFPNYLMHTAYPFNVKGERRSYSFNIKIVYKNNKE